MSEEIIKLSATTLSRMIRERKISPVDVVAAYLRQIEDINSKVNAIVTLAPDAIERAKESEKKLLSGEDVGVLHGVPVTIKDTIATKDLRTTSGSKIFADNIPTEDANVVSLLKNAGAIVIAKTNTSELAMDCECDNPLFGRTNNPHDLSKTSGGSSGGDAAAVAANMTPIGIGSDMMGSIRIPAHFCGVSGLKPTTGIVPSRGQMPKAEGVYSLGSVVGPIARTAEDLRLVFSVIAGQQIQHSTFNIQNSEIQNLKSKIQNGKIAFYTNDGITPVTNETKQTVIKAAKLFSEAGFIVEEKLPPHVERSAELWMKLFQRGGFFLLNELYKGHEEDAGATVSAILKYGGVREQSLYDFLDTWAERDRLRYELIDWMNDYPLIISPVCPVPAHEHGARRIEIEGQTLKLMQIYGYCQTWNVFGFPSATVPAGRSTEGLPIGVQLISKPFADYECLEAAAILEGLLKV